MITFSCNIDTTNVLVALIGSFSVLIGLWFSFKQWKSEKECQRINDKKELLTKLVGQCLGNLDFVVLQYRKWQKELKDNKSSEEKWKEFQNKIEPHVKESEIILNEVELKINDIDLIAQLQKIKQAFITIINKCTETETNVSTDLDEFSLHKQNLINMAKQYLNSQDNTTFK